jgi:23S rRNA pseudouridine2605 synthase
MEKKERVQKLMAYAGVASRRKCEEIIQQGRVKVNGRTIHIGDTAYPNDTITVDGRELKKQEKVYIMLHKPKGYVTTAKETHGMKTVMQLIRTPQRVYPVGRLDKNTEGLLLLTNDGELANKITHPRHGVWKTYEAWLDKPFKHQEFLLKGITIEQHRVVPVIVSIEGKKVVLKLHEGQKHVVRIMFEKFGYDVVRLLRTQVASLSLGKLARGTYRELKKTELDYLRKILDHT